jgi:hypothetical protein
MTRVADRRAARREARKRRAELRLFGAAWKYGAGFDARACAPILIRRAPPRSRTFRHDTDELLADLVAPLHSRRFRRSASSSRPSLIKRTTRYT